MDSRVRYLSAILVISGCLISATGLTVVALIAHDPISGTFGGGGGVPTYYYFESTSGGLPLVPLGIVMTAAGCLIFFHNHKRADRILHA